MRKTIVLSCLIGLGLSFALIAFKKTAGPGTREQNPAVAPSPGPTIRETTISAAVASPAGPLSAKDRSTAGLLTRIQAGLKSDAAEEQMRVFNELFPALVNADPEAAAAFAQSPDAGNWRTDLMRVVAQSWAGKDAAAAINWAAKIPDQTERDTAVSHVCLQVGQSDPAWAIQALEQQGAGNFQSAMLENLAQRWAEKDFAAANAWVCHQPPGAERDQMLMRIAFAQSQTEPASAARIVAEQIPAGPVQNDAALAILNQWALKDLPGATAWANQFPDGKLSEQAKQALAGIAAYQSEPD